MTEFLQLEPTQPAFTGDELEHLQAVLDGLDDFEGVELGDIEDDWTRDAVAAHRQEIGACVDCGGEFVTRRIDEPQCYLVGDYEVCEGCGEIAQ
jgi:hypothetical protein